MVKEKNNEKFALNFRALGENFSALRIPGIRIYMTGQVFNFLGDWTQQTAQVWLVWELTHKATALGIVTWQEIADHERKYFEIPILTDSLLVPGVYLI